MMMKKCPAVLEITILAPSTLMSDKSTTHHPEQQEKIALTFRISNENEQSNSSESS